jgi:hypothetical protein
VAVAPKGRGIHCHFHLDSPKTIALRAPEMSRLIAANSQIAYLGTWGFPYRLAGVQTIA